MIFLTSQIRFKMKLKSIILFVIFMLNIPESQAHTNVAIFHTDYQISKAISNDTLRAEFNLKKKNIAYLIRGKSPENMLTFYGFYLQGKDQLRADSLIHELLKSEDAVDNRYKISLLSYRYTSDTRTQQLFLSNPDSLKAYRTYFLKYKVSSLKSNGDKRAHYYNLVALDTAYYKIAPDSLVEKQMAKHYNSLAWNSIVTQQLDGVENYLNQSIRYDPQSKYPVANLPLLLVLKGRYKEALALYMKLKDQPFDEPGTTFKDEFLVDFKELAQVGMTSKDIKKITELLNSKE